MTGHQTILILDFGGQYNQLIARRVREQGVYCEVWPYHRAMEKLAELRPIGVILTGGPNSIYREDSPTWTRRRCARGCRCWASATASRP